MITQAKYRPHNIPESIKRKARKMVEEDQKEYGHHLSFSVAKALEYISELIGGYGVEGMIPEGMHPRSEWDGFQYVNMGDTYASTVVYDSTTHRFYWGVSWGDIFEMHERKGIEYP